VDLDDARQVEVEVGPLAGPEVPDGRPILTLALVDDGQPLVPGHRRPGPGVQPHAFVA